VFRVDYTVEVAGNKEFGSLFLQNGQQQENVALSIVQNGWAKVCRVDRNTSCVQEDTACG
jgi:staphylococcal nuclease domain-containing protein 1